MPGSSWQLMLLVSDGCHRCSHSSATDSDLRAGLLRLQSMLTPPPPATARPVWIRLDARPPDDGPERGEELRQEMCRQLLEPMGIRRQPLTLSRPQRGLLHLWLDLSRPARPHGAPLLEALERARGWLLRRLELQDQATPLNPVDALAALLLLRGASDRPDLDLTAFRLTRALQQSCPTAGGDAGSDLQLAMQLAVLTHQLQGDHTTHPELEIRCRTLQAELLARSPDLSPAVRPAALFSLALAQVRGLTNDSWLKPVTQRLVRLLQGGSGCCWERSWCLLTLVVLAESRSGLPAVLRHTLADPSDLQALAGLPATAASLTAPSALRAVLLLRLAGLLKLPLKAGIANDWAAAAERVVLRLQLGPLQAIEARDPQLVLGAFGGDPGGPAPLRRQLPPLLALHHLQLLEKHDALG